MFENFSTRLSWRPKSIALLEQVRDGQGKAEDLERFATEMPVWEGRAIVGDPVWAFAELLLALAKALPWRQAVRDAELAPERFRIAASTRANDVLAAKKANQWWPDQLEAAAIALRDLDSPTGVHEVASKLLAVPLPARTTEATLPERRIVYPRTPKASPQPDPIAVDLFVNGEPIPTPFGMVPFGVISVEVKVKRLPGSSVDKKLRIGFDVDLSEGQHEFAIAEIPPGKVSTTTNFQLRAIIEPPGSKREVQVWARVVEADGNETPLGVVGHAKFDIMTRDSSHEGNAGLPWLAMKLDEMIAELDLRLRQLPRSDRDDFIALYRSLCIAGHTAIADRQFANNEDITEAKVQETFKRMLRFDRTIGGRLQEGTRLAGGFVDLILGSTNLELKLEKNRAVAIADAHRYVSQPTFYGAAADNPVSVLCIVDASPKAFPPANLSNYMGWMMPQVHGLDAPQVPSMVAVLVVPVGFGAPHDGGRSTRRRIKGRSKA